MNVATAEPNLFIRIATDVLGTLGVLAGFALLMGGVSLVGVML